MELSKNLLALIIIIIMVIFQIFAWAMGHNGTIQAFVLSVLAALVGVIFGFKIAYKRT